MYKLITKGLRLLFIVALAAGLALGAAPVPVAHAATINVNSTTDNTTAGDGTCTLREAINNANADADTTGGDCAAGSGADTISLLAGTYTLTIVSTDEDANADGDLDITGGSDLTIQGAGAATTIIDGNGSVTNGRVLHITISDITVSIDGVTIQNGNMGDWGGGIYNHGSHLNVANSIISGNQASHHGGGIFNFGGTATISNSTISGNQTIHYGGGIDNSGAVTITNSTISGNQANWGGGGIRNSGGTLNVANSTLSGNQADSDGGGIYNGSGTTTLDNVTISGNTASGDGGGVTGDPQYGGIVNLRNTIIAGNTDTGGEAPDGSGTLTSLDYNLVGNSTGCTITLQANDQIGTGGSPIDPMLGPLADNGGATHTHALLIGSPAIDKGHCTDSGGNPVTTDQRGVARPQGATCDVGAYEKAIAPGVPDLSIGKSAIPDPVIAGGLLTYTINVAERGGLVDATGVQMTDTIPADTVFAWADNGGSLVGGDVLWSGLTISASQSISIAFVVTASYRPHATTLRWFLHNDHYQAVIATTAGISVVTGSAVTTTVRAIGAYLPTIQRNNVITP